MKSFIFLLIAIWPLVLFANNSNKGNYFNHLYEVNKEWSNHEEDYPDEQVYFETDEDAIQAHLLLVCKSLTKNKPNNLNEDQLKSRLQLIQVLREYASEKVFPTNLYHAERTPYFVDDFGVHCAVGYLMSQSGSKELVAAIRANENYSYIADIKTPGVSEWAFEHGFTIDELKWIQPGYIPSPDAISQVGDGTNGPINKMIKYNATGELVVAGEFDSLDLEPCLNIGVYHDNQLSCLGNGISGKINDLTISNGKIFAFGELEHQGTSYTIAYFENGAWEFINIPTREGAVATAGSSVSIYLEVAINHPNDDNVQEVWRQSTLNTWEKEFELNGIIKKIGGSSYGRIFAGKFNEAIIYDDQGVIEDTIITNNVIFRDNADYDNWEALNGTSISDTVETFLFFNNQVYFGGTATKESASSGVVLSRYLNNTLQPVLVASDFEENNPVSINSIKFGPTNGSLLIGGDFYFISGIGTSGKNLAILDVFDNQLTLVAWLDKSVNSIAMYDNQIFFGGDFKTNLTTTQLNHLGKFDATVGINDESLENIINVFPNPFTDVVEIQGITSNYTYQILDGNGRVVREEEINSDTTIELRDLTSGVYIFNLQTENGIISKRLIKQ